MKIGVDLDEVLAEFVESFLPYHNNLHHTDYKKGDIFSYNFPDVYGYSKEENLQEIFEFQQSEQFMQIQPVAWAHEVLRWLSKNHELYVITSRQDYVEEKTQTRINIHYPNIFKKIYFTNEYSLSGAPRRKADVCDELWIELMIDDSLIYAEQCATAKRKILLYNRPRNQSKPNSPYIQRVQDRNEINTLF